MKKHTVLFSIVALFISINSFAADLEFFPTKRIAENPHPALLRSPALDILYTYSSMDNKQYMCFNFGSKLCVLYLKTDGGVECEFSGYGGAYTRFELFSESFNFVHLDMLGGGAFDLKYNKFTFETAVYHNSSHLGDDYIHYEGAPYENVGFEAVKHYTTYDFSKVIGGTLGFEYKFGRRPKNIVFYNFSVFIGNRINFLSMGVPVFIDWEMEVIGFKYTPNVGVRIGVFLSYLFNNVFFNKGIYGSEPHEFSIFYYYGYSKMGQFYNKKESLFLIGPTYRF